MSTPLDLIVAWHDAVRDRDIEAVVDLVHSDVEWPGEAGTHTGWGRTEVGGPKGSGRGVELMREWVQNSGIVLEIESFLQRGLTFVVAQTVTWPDPATGTGRTEPIAAASVFVVLGSRLSKVLRFDDVDSALDAAGIRAPGQP